MAKKRSVSKKKNLGIAKIDLGTEVYASLDELAGLIEARNDSAKAKEIIEKKVEAAKPGTIGALRLVQAADAIEDEDFLLRLARRGLFEALRSRQLAAAIREEVAELVVKLANARAAVQWSAAEPGSWVSAEFGGAVAVNGELLLDDDLVPTRPKDYVLSGTGGLIPYVEESVAPATVAGAVVSVLGLDEARGALAVVTDLLLEEPEVVVTVSGQTEVWVKPGVKSRAGLSSSSFDAP